MSGARSRPPDCASRRATRQDQMPWALLMAGVVLASALATNAEAKAPKGAKTVAIHDGPVTLQGLIWRPQGHGPFPAILLNHGSGRTHENWKGSDRTRNRLTYSGPCSLAMDMCSCFYSGAVLGCPAIKAPMPSI